MEIKIPERFNKLNATHIPYDEEISNAYKPIALRILGMCGFKDASEVCRALDNQGCIRIY